MVPVVEVLEILRRVLSCIVRLHVILSYCTFHLIVLGCKGF